MNLTIFALQTSIITMSPLFTKARVLNIEKSSFSYFTSPLLYNVFGKIEHSSFNNGLSSLVIIDKVTETPPISKTLNGGDTFEYKGNEVHEIVSDDPIIFIDGDGTSVSISQNDFAKCTSKAKTGLIVISCKAKTTFNYNCFASCYSESATTLCIGSPGQVSFVTTISEFYSNADCSFKVNNQNNDILKFNNINVSNSNLLESGAFWALDNSKLSISYLHFGSSYDMRCFTIERNTEINFQNCELFDLTSQISIFRSSSSFEIVNSFFFGLVFNNFIEALGDSCTYTFSNCGFDLSKGLVSESFISYKNCYFDVEITFTNNAEFLNLGNCNGRNFTTYQSIFKKFSTEEILGMIVCVIGIALSIIMIIAQILSLLSKNDEYHDEDYSEVSDYDFSLSEEEEQEKPKKRKHHKDE